LGLFPKWRNFAKSGHTARRQPYKRKWQPLIKFVNVAKCKLTPGTWGRCYDNNFQRVSPIFGENLAFFLKTNVLIIFLHKLAVLWVKYANLFAEFFGENIFKIITSVPVLKPLSNLTYWSHLTNNMCRDESFNFDPDNKWNF
jgi:hypothetical protein